MVGSVLYGTIMIQYMVVFRPGGVLPWSVLFWCGLFEGFCPGGVMSEGFCPGGGFVLWGFIRGVLSWWGFGRGVLSWW